MESNLQQLQLRGRLALWKFSPDNFKYIGWNLAADVEGCLALVELLEGMQAAPASSAKSLTTGEASASLVKAVSGSKPHRTVGRLTLHYRKGEPLLWIIEEREEGLEITLGEREIELLQTALYRVMKGEADFAIGDANDSHLLYFWPFAEGK